jgi:hypothetical protein
LKFLLAARKISRLFTILILLNVLLVYCPCFAQEGEETYDISLVKTADPDSADEIHEVDGKKVLAETYTVKDGDHLWQILREKKLLEKKNLVELLSVLKKLNNSLDNIDMIHPGERIIIPLAISPSAGGSQTSVSIQPETVPLEAIGDIDLEEYVVKQGDSVIKIVEDLYDIPQKELYNEYLSRLRQLNPEITDLNTVYPGQKVRFPVYSPKVVRLPVEESQPVSEPMTESQKQGVRAITGQLGEIFTLIGEQWLETGEHFFPLKTGGQLKLNAESYPIVELRSGKKVIVDLYNDLPERMGRLITSNWDNYGIVHLEGDDDLKQAFDRITAVCDYKRIYGPGEPLVSGGEIPVRITSDRIIEQEQGASAEEKRIAVINFCDDASDRNPEVIIRYLEMSGIKVIDYPVLNEKAEISYNDTEIINTMDDMNSFVETLLDVTGQNYSANVELPVYKNGKGAFDLVVKADYSVHINGKDYIIDLSGLGKDIVNLLKESQFMAYSISGSKTPSDIVTGIFDFLGIKYESMPHQFFSTNRPENKNIILNIQGITFIDSESNKIFATSLRLSRELIFFLNMKGYRIFQLPVAIAPYKGGSN